MLRITFGCFLLVFRIASYVRNIAAKHSYTFNWITTHSLQIMGTIQCTTLHGIIHMQRVHLLD